MANADNDNELVKAVLGGLISAVVSVPLAFLVLDAYVSATVGTGSPELVSSISYAALAAVGFSSFFSGFFSSYYTHQENM